MEELELETTVAKDSEVAADVGAIAEEFVDETPVEEIEEVPTETSVEEVEEVEEATTLDPNTDDLGEKAEIANGGEVAVDEAVPFEEGAPLGDLSLEIEGTTLPESATELGSPGSVDVMITNEGDKTLDGTIDLNLYVSSDKKINTRVLPLTGKEVQDGLLTTLEDVDMSGLEPGDSKTVTVDYENITSFVPPGSQFLIAEIEEESLGEGQDVVSENNSDDVLVSLPGTDVVLDWQTVGANLTTNQFLFDELVDVGAAPPQGTRAGALLSASMFNAFAGVTGEFDPYAIDLDAIEMSPEGASVEAAIAGASATVLSELYPEQQDIIDAQMDLSLDEIDADPAAEMLGLTYGSLVAQELLDMRADEFASFDDPLDPDNSEFIPIDADDPFFWSPDDNGSGVAVGAQYGDTAIPYAIESSDAIVSLISPDAPDSQEFFDDLQAVAVLGGAADTEATTILRTDDQSEIAKFFFVDRGDSYKPNKHIGHIAQEISIDEGFDLKQNVELFFKLNLALADAVIVTWDAKYNEQYPRPSQPITEDLGIDPDWKAFLEEPGFPDWISGHSTMAYAAEVVFTEQFGDIGTFGVVSPDTPGIEREYDSFGELFDEFSLSRVFAGVHTIDGAFTDPDTAGTAVGEEVLATLAPLTGDAI
ncbi:MAG: vanadium-dependent haloperoxidase [Cyanobacteria bacterium J06588_4]